MWIREKAVTLSLVVFCSVLLAPPAKFQRNRRWIERCLEGLAFIGIGKRGSQAVEEPPAPEKEQLSDPTKSSVYLASDFPQSELSPLGQQSAKEHALYANWAAKNADIIAREFHVGTPMKSILGRIKAARTTLAKEMGTVDWESFGRDRKTPSPYFPDGRPRTGMGAPGPVRESLSKLANGKIQNAGGTARLKENTYTTLDGTTISCSGLEKSSFGLSIRHTSIENMVPILKDVLQRLENLRQDVKTASVTDRQKVFLKCLFGYYNAMPYLRGSSAIGRPFFAGIYRGAFGTKAPIFEDAIDVKAMILTEDEFIEELLQLPELVAARGIPGPARTSP